MPLCGHWTGNNNGIFSVRSYYARPLEQDNTTTRGVVWFDFHHNKQIQLFSVPFFNFLSVIFVGS